MLRALWFPAAVALAVAALAGCASGAQLPGQPSSPVLSRASSPAEAGTSPSPSPTAPKRSGIAGRTVLMNCPADRADPPCAGVPVRARLAVLDATTQAVITNVDTDAKGNFTVVLAAGTYLLRPVEVGSQPARRPVTTRVAVAAGQYTSITLRINNGLQ
jgi:hypothetical protein